MKRTFRARCIHRSLRCLLVTQFVEALTERDGQGAYYLERGAGGQAVETRIDPRRL
jgi:hypothetical protein